jgi:hypothetical protein
MCDFHIAFGKISDGTYVGHARLTANRIYR